MNCYLHPALRKADEDYRYKNKIYDVIKTFAMASPKYDYHSSMERMSRGQYPTTQCGFLKEMVHHHQIAGEMADVIMQYTKNPQISVLARDIIWAQKGEIAQMRLQQTSYVYESELLSDNDCNSPSQLHLYYKTECPIKEDSLYTPDYGSVTRDPDYYKSMSRMMKKDYPKDDCEFMKEMVVHHQIAVEMARVMEKHTKNPAMLNLLRNIIWNQTLEITLMKRLLLSYDVNKFPPNNIPWKYEEPALSCYDPYLTTSKNIAKDKCSI